MNPSSSCRSALWVAVTGMAVSGCSSITGLDGSSEYACKAPPGVKCDSVSGTYHNAINDNLPAQRKQSGGAAAQPVPASRSTGQPRPSTLSSRSAEMLPTVAPAAPPTGQRPGELTPLRLAPRQLRLWIKPWEDGERDLNGESVVYVQIDNGRWLLDAAQRSVREPFAPRRGVAPTAAAARAPSTSLPAPAAAPSPMQGAQPRGAAAGSMAMSAAAVPATRLLPPEEDAQRLQEALRQLQPQQQQQQQQQRPSD